MALTKAQIFTSIGTNFPDNNTGAITPENVRTVTTQIADAMMYEALGVKEVEILRSSSGTSQSPTALNTPLQVIFGAASGSAANPVMINAAGTVTFNTAGTYAIRVKLQVGRLALAGAATVNTRILINDVQTGSPAAVRVDSSAMITPTESRVVINATAGQTFKVQIMRDGADGSVNAGGIFAVTSAVGAWGVSPSALIVVSRLEPVT